MNDEYIKEFIQAIKVCNSLEDYETVINKIYEDGFEDGYNDGKATQ
jgi:hypothetical protein